MISQKILNKPACAFIRLTVLIALSDFPLQAQMTTRVEQWGFIGGRTGGWSIEVGEPGNVTISGEALKENWSAIRGGFVETIKPTFDEPLVVTGVLEFDGAGFESWSGLRYGIFRHDSVGVLAAAGTDSAHWTGNESDAYGYLFTPRSGTNGLDTWACGGPGTQGVVKGGNWLSTFGGGNGHESLGVINQSPPRAVAIDGHYYFGISIRPLLDGSNEVKFFLTEKYYRYWFGGICVDSSQITSSFNGVCFAVNYNNPDIRALHIREITIGTGELTPPPGPTSYYLDTWGFISDRFGGWRLRPGDLFGNVTLSGSAPNSSWVAIRGEFIEPPQWSVTAKMGPALNPVRSSFFDSITPQLGEALVVTGRIEFMGGGFQAANSFRFGIFDSDSTG